MNVAKIKTFGTYVGYHDEYGFVYKVEDNLYALKGGKIDRIWEEIIL